MSLSSPTSDFPGLTAEHAAPETVSHGQRGAAADVYGLGSTLHTALAGRSPRDSALPPDTPEPLAALLAEMLDADPARRLAASRVIQRLSELRMAGEQATTMRNSPTGDPTRLRPMAVPVVPHRSRRKLILAGAASFVVFRRDVRCGVLCSNPIGASGLLRFAEAARQVMGRAGDHQVPDARRALGHAYGGGSQFFSMWVVSS